MAGATGLEPAISGLTGRRVNQLHHAPARGLREGSPMVGRTESFPGATYSGKFIRPSGSWKHGSERRSSNAGFFSKRRRELACFGMSTGGGLVGRVLFFFQRIALFVLGDDRLKLWITVQRWHFLPGCFY